jgi:hypothetical protein
MTPEDLITLTAGRSVQPLVAPGTGRPYWTVAEAGQACAGLEPEIFAAMLFTYAGADDCIPLLKRKLVAFASVMRQEERWPMKVRRENKTEGDYLEELVGLSLFEEAQPYRFGGPDGSVVAPMYLTVMNVKMRVWMDKLAHPYAVIRWRYITWLSIGRSHMRRWMRTNSQGVDLQRRTA